MLDSSRAQQYYASVHAVPDVITYANGRVLKNAKHEIFYADGCPFYRNGTIYYPGWYGGRENYHPPQPGPEMGRVEDNLVYPNGSRLFERKYATYYPGPNKDTGGPYLYDGWSYTWKTGLRRFLKTIPRPPPITLPRPSYVTGISCLLRTGTPPTARF
jgi:hypothetical protein